MIFGWLFNPTREKVLPSHWQIIIIFRCNIKQQLNFPSLVHAIMFQFTVLYAVLKASQTIWKYNTLFHLTSEHAIDSTPSKTPRKHLADVFITREEEKALEIIEEAMYAWRMIFQRLKVYWK
jgi:hypothetical protein